jgi:hypothetical protein
MFILHFHLKKLIQSIEYQIHFAENEIKKSKKCGFSPKDNKNVIHTIEIALK